MLAQSTGTQLAIFDYGELDSETRIVVQQRTSEIKTLMRRAAQDIIDIGQKLIEVKARLGHGNFGAWLDAEFQWTPQLARQFMNVAESFSGIENETIFRFGSSALRLLAAPSTPESARIEAVERAQAGESITHSAAREIVSEHKTSRPAPITRHKEPEAIETPAEDDQSAWQPQEPEPQPEEQPTALDYVFPQRQAYQPIQEPEAPTAPSSERTQQRNVLTSQESDEWYTPSWCLDLVKQVLGHIELDPASSERANETVQARRFYTETDNGLVQSWQAHTLFLNPPYNGDAAQWSRKLVEVYGHGTVSEAILLVFGKLGYRWFEELWDRYPVAFTRERISFISASDRTTSQAKHVSAFIYFGQQREKFRQVFSGVGRVIYPEEGRYHDMHD